MKFAQIIKRLRVSKYKILSIQDIKKLLEIGSDNTAYKTAEKLVKKEVLGRLGRGLYFSVFHQPGDYEIANRLRLPSYVSLETALNYYGILSQFPYAITSVTTARGKKRETGGKEFDYAHLQKSLFWGYEERQGFLIAQPEKALVDTLYLAAKGWRKIDFAGLDYSKINKKRFRAIASKIKLRSFRNALTRIKI